MGTEFDDQTSDYQTGGVTLNLRATPQAKHRFNPPSCPKAIADVESVHNALETELFDAKAFPSKADFFAKAAIYQL